MPQPILISKVDQSLRPAPINPDWVMGGTPTARNKELSRSRDGLASTLLWDCTPGRFEWIYDTDETIHILEGSVVLDDGVAPPRTCVAGDVVFFPAGARVRWTVETHLRKLAFFRRGLPGPAAAIVSNLRNLKGALRGVKALTRRRSGQNFA